MRALDPALVAIFGVFAFAMGAVVASFLNVVVWRAPVVRRCSAFPVT